MTVQTAVVVEDVKKRYRDKEAVRGVSFTVDRGEIFGILGPNGAGKTTTIEMMEGLRARDSGRIEVLGLDPARQPQQLRERIGVQFQTTALQDRLRVSEALQLFGACYGRTADLARLVERLGLEPYMRKAFKDLSGGWRQRVSLALALVHNPDVVFLDEPTTGLDPAARREVWALIEALRDEGKTVVLTTHYMEEAERLCDRVAMFQAGRIAYLDQPKRLLARLSLSSCLTFESAEASLSSLSELLQGIGLVESRHDGRIAINASDLQAAAWTVFDAARRMGWTIRDFRFETGSLDDLFVTMAQTEGGHEA